MNNVDKIKAIKEQLKVLESERTNLLNNAPAGVTPGQTDDSDVKTGRRFSLNGNNTVKAGNLIITKKPYISKVNAIDSKIKTLKVQLRNLENGNVKHSGYSAVGSYYGVVSE